MKKLLFFSVLVVGLLPFLSCNTANKNGMPGKKDDDSGKKEFLKVSYKMNLAQADYASNFFNWSFGETSIEDKFDATSQASMKQTKEKFNAVRFAGPKAEKKWTMPQSLRGLFFFPLADYKYVNEYALTVLENAGVITITFGRKDKAFMLTTDAKGEFDVLTGSKIATEFAEKVNEGGKDIYKIKNEYLVKGGNPTNLKDLNWEALTPIMKEDKFVADAAHHFEGKLKFVLKDNILSISGKLQKI